MSAAIAVHGAPPGEILDVPELGGGRGSPRRRPVAGDDRAVGGEGDAVVGDVLLADRLDQLAFRSPQRLQQPGIDQARASSSPRSTRSQVTLSAAACASSIALYPPGASTIWTSPRSPPRTNQEEVLHGLGVAATPGRERHAADLRRAPPVWARASAPRSAQPRQRRCPCRAPEKTGATYDPWSTLRSSSFSSSLSGVCGPSVRLPLEAIPAGGGLPSQDLDPSALDIGRASFARSRVARGERPQHELGARQGVRVRPGRPARQQHRGLDARRFEGVGAACAPARPQGGSERFDQVDGLTASTRSRPSPSPPQSHRLHTLEALGAEGTARSRARARSWRWRPARPRGRPPRRAGRSARTRAQDPVRPRRLRAPTPLPCFTPASCQVKITPSASAPARRQA